MAVAPRALLWQITRNYNSSLVKRDGIRFSAHPLNPTNESTPSSDGISNSRAVNVTFGPDNTVVVLKKNPRSANKPAKSVSKIAFSSGRTVKNPRGVTKSVRAIAKSAGRADLKDGVAGRYARVHKILHKKSGGVTKKFHGRRSAAKQAAQSN